MQKLHFSILINAPKEKVWHAMLDDKSYREWTVAFNPGSYYKGDWNKGSKILFLGSNPETGKEGGMVSRIAEHKPYEFISIEHLGIVHNGVEDTTSDEARKWAPAFENYSFKEKGGATEVLVDTDVDENETEVFNKMWPEALQKLKEIAETKLKQ
ncbi:MAG: SRPBCC family protein [Bellilinea sp.]